MFIVKTKYRYKRKVLIPFLRVYKTLGDNSLLKLDETTMELDKEKAMEIWNQCFGNETKVLDFSGRIIQKGAYLDESNNFGWIVFLIVPKSKGGKRIEGNLMICHMKTNKEKGDKFPSFKANGILFRIVKNKNHYEIQRVDNKPIQYKITHQCPDFMDANAAIRFYDAFKKRQAESPYVASILIRLLNVGNTAIIDFIEKIFKDESILYDKKNYSEMRIIIRKYNVLLKSDTNLLLDKCILLNTYLKAYFKVKELIEAYDIIYRVDAFISKETMYSKIKYVDCEGVEGTFDNALFINRLVYENTEAIENEPDLSFSKSVDSYQDYDYTYPRLEKYLKK